jgi:hypothetical protein
MINFRDHGGGLSSKTLEAFAPRAVLEAFIETLNGLTRPSRLQ